MKITFTGSCKPCEDEPDGAIHFNAYYEDEIGGNCVIDAFRKTLLERDLAKSDDLKEIEHAFLSNMIELRNAKH